jgi:hypothetical protein
VLGYILLTVKNKSLSYLKHLQVEADYSKKYEFFSIEASLFCAEINKTIGLVCGFTSVKENHYRVSREPFSLFSYF